MHEMSIVESIIQIVKEQVAQLDLLFVENVGNLICPAEFEIGEDRKVVVLSITKGEDKPLKYPLMFRVCDAVLIQ